MKTIKLRCVENDKLKITISEFAPTGCYTYSEYQVLFWDKKLGSEIDNKVYEFETYGGAMECAFELLAEANNLFVKKEY